MVSRRYAGLTRACLFSIIVSKYSGGGASATGAEPPDTVRHLADAHYLNLMITTRRRFVTTLAVLPLVRPASGQLAMDLHQLSPDWEFVADTVMGGVSTGAVTQGMMQGRAATRLTGAVSLDNDGGFVQVATDIRSVENPADWTGIALDVMGNDETYDMRLRTDDLSRPWQSYRTDFAAPNSWQRLLFPFNAFERHKTDAPFDPAKLRRLGVVAIGREFTADISISALYLYRAQMAGK